MILFFYGANSFDLRQKVKELVERYKSKTGNNFGLERFDGSNQDLSVGQVVSAITNLSLLGDSRLVIIEDLLSNKLLAEGILANFERVPQSTVFIILESQPDERTKIFKEFKAKTTPKKFELLNTPALKQWVQRIVSELGGEINEAEALFLIDRVGNDQWRLRNELLKLVNFNPQITRESIGELVEPSFQNTIFDLLEAVSRQEVNKALTLYEGLRANKAQPLYVLSMLGWQFKNLIVVKAAQQVRDVPLAGQIARDFQMNPFIVNKSLTAVQKVSFKSLKAAHSLIITTDYKIKTTSAPPDGLIEQLIIDTAQILSPPTVS